MTLRVVVEFGQEAGLPVVERTGGVAGVQQGVNCRTGHRAYLRQDSRAVRQDRSEVAFGLPAIARVADRHGGDSSAGSVGGA